MATQTSIAKAMRVSAATLLLTVCIAPWGAGVAATQAVTASSDLHASTGTWAALIATPGTSGTQGSPLAITSGLWSRNVTYPSPVGKVDAGYIVDVVNSGAQPLLAQDYVMTVTQFDIERFVSLWLCSGGIWSGSVCSGSVVAVGTAMDVTGNGTYSVSTRGAANPSCFTLAPGARLSLLVTNTSKGNTAPKNIEALGVRVQRADGVRVGIEVSA